MSRYIDADALIKDLKRQDMFLFGTDDLPNGIQSVIKNFPTTDVVEVVRCKDCENWDTHGLSTFRPDAHYCIVLDNAFYGDFFCACGVRRKKI